MNKKDIELCRILAEKFYILKVGEKPGKRNIIYQQAKIGYAYIHLSNLLGIIQVDEDQMRRLYKKLKYILYE